MKRILNIVAALLAFAVMLPSCTAGVQQGSTSKGEVVKTGLPKSNVLYFELPNDCWCCARPSGTEPKIKFYMGVTGDSLEDSQMKLGQLTEAVKQFVK